MSASTAHPAEPVRVTLGRVALIEIDNPPVNASSQAVRAGLADAIRRIEQSPDVAAAVIACAGRTFVAGADIREFGQPPREPHLPDVVNAIEASTKPVVAAVHGSALGGGFEIALACHGRVFAKDASAGLPEVKLGIVPGAGGTQRLPRLVGAARAVEMFLTARRLTAGEAFDCGLVSYVDEDSLGRALEVARGART
jgi:3-hydroxyacyl-CoA dehydrogenase